MDSLTYQEGNASFTVAASALAGLGRLSEYLWTATSLTGLTASTEWSQFMFDGNVAIQFETGAITTQRSVIWNAPEYSFVGASTITFAPTVTITNAPQAGTNATIIYPSALTLGSGGTITYPSHADFAYASLRYPTQTVNLTGTTQITSRHMGYESFSQLTLRGDGSALTVDYASTIYAFGAPVGTNGVTITNPYVLFMDEGLSRFDGNGTHVFELPADATGNVTAATGRIPIKVGGATKYIRYFND